jgi:hypothetical protein
MRSHRPSPAMVVAIIALIVALGGGAYAALSRIPDSSGVFHGCVNKQNGGLRVVRSSLSCRGTKKRHGRIVFPGEFAIAWNQQGRSGANGTNGTDGTARAYGRVSAGAALTRSKNVTGIAHVPGSGVYCIALAAGIDATQTDLVATADFSDDATRLGTGTSLTFVELATNFACPATQLEVNTGRRAEVSTGSPDGDVRNVNNTASDQSFFFVVP